MGHPLNTRMKNIYVWDTLYKKGWKMLGTLFIRKHEGYIFWTPCKKMMTIIYIWDTLWKEGWRIIYILLGFIKYPGFYLIKGRILNLSTKSENRKLLFAQKFSHGNCYDFRKIILNLQFINSWFLPQQQISIWKSELYNSSLMYKYIWQIEQRFLRKPP